MSMTMNGSARTLPSTIDIEVCNICNYHCSVCTTGNRRMNRVKSLLLPERLESLLDIFSREGLTATIRINCVGEPFMNPHIYDILEILKARGHLGHGRQVIINTNASLIDAGRLARFGRDLILQVSLDSVHPDVYKVYRHNDRRFFDLAMAAIVELSKTPVTTGLFTLVTRHNQDHLQEITGFGRKLGLPVTFTAFQCSPFGVTQDMLPAGVSVQDNWITRTYVTPDDFAAFSPTRPDLEKHIIYEPSGDGTLYRKKGSNQRPCGYTAISWIGPDGTVLPCCLEAYYNSVSFGNVFAAGSFTDVWFSEPYRAFRQDLATRTTAAHAPCRICHK